MHQGVPNDEVLTDSDFLRLDFDVTQPDLRNTDMVIVNLIKEMFVEVRQMRDEGRLMRKDLKDHIQDETAVISHGFPDGDPDSHRAYHEVMIEKAKAEAEFYKDLKSSAAKWGLFGILSFLLAAAWFYILSKVKS